MLVTVSGQSWPESVSNLAEPGQSRPRLHVLHGGGAECSQVPQYHLLQRGVRMHELTKRNIGVAFHPNGRPRQAPGAPDIHFWSNYGSVCGLNTLSQT